MISRGEHYRDSTVDYEEMAVQRTTLDQGAEKVRVYASTSLSCSHRELSSLKTCLTRMKPHQG